MDEIEWLIFVDIMKEPHEGFYRKVIANFDKPLLIIHGSKDFRTGEEGFKKSGGKNFQLEVVEGADHMLLMDPMYNQQFATKVRSFTEKALKESTSL